MLLTHRRIGLRCQAIDYSLPDAFHEHSFDLILRNHPWPNALPHLETSVKERPKTSSYKF
jgi:hypothetical protein